MHIPYCRVKCPYCDFNVYAVRRVPEEEYLSALLSELEHAAREPTWRDRPLASVFFGGGTPSIFHPSSIGALLDRARTLWPVVADSFEVSLEANPGTIDVNACRHLLAAGVNRLSVGVQSFEPELLGRLGRDHTAEEAMEAIGHARAAGFRNVTLDLIFAVPGQGVDLWRRDLERAIALQPEHVSCYGLTYEERTPFRRWRDSGRLRPVPEEHETQMFLLAQELLGAAGFAHYEVSNYARPGFESAHNLNYWLGGDYLGIGAGAHSFCREPFAGRRWSNERLPRRYMECAQQRGEAVAFRESLTVEQARAEFTFLALRTRRGVSDAAFAERFGVGFVTAFPHATGLAADGLLEHEGGRWRLSDRGLLLLDSVSATFVTATDAALGDAGRRGDPHLEPTKDTGRAESDARRSVSARNYSKRTQ